MNNETLAIGREIDNVVVEGYDTRKGRGDLKWGRGGLWGGKEREWVGGKLFERKGRGGQ